MGLHLGILKTVITLPIVARLERSIALSIALIYPYIIYKQSSLISLIYKVIEVPILPRLGSPHSAPILNISLTIRVRRKLSTTKR